MKKLILITLSIISIQISHSQSLAPQGAQWSYSLRSNFNSTVEPYTIQAGADTVVYGRTAQFHRNINSKLPFPCPAGLENNLMAESNDSVFIYEDNRWQMLVNFNASPLDTFSITIAVKNYNGTQTAYRIIQIQVDSIKTVRINGIPLKAVYLRRFNFGPMPTYTFFDGWFTQRIGSKYSFIPWVNAGCAYSSYFMAELRCYSDGTLGSIQYSSYACNAVITDIETKSIAEFELFPNPTSESIYLKKTTNVEEVLIYDYTGKFIQSTKSSFQEIKLPSYKGVYFIQIKLKNGNSYSQKIIKI